jgi:hypothetical protein
MKFKVSELDGHMLDAAVFKANSGDAGWLERNKGIPPRYSSKWENGGPIIARERIACYWRSSMFADGEPYPAGVTWVAGMNMQTALEGFTGDERCFVSLDNRMVGQTTLVAAMRAYVANKFGEEIDLP